MKEDKTNPFEIDFDSYILQSEPEQQENGKLWQTAIGLQQVDGLTPSKYLYETAKRNIDGEITIEEAKQLIDSYYETRQGRTEDEDDFEEADKVSVRIREILAEKTFSFTPELLLSIHKRLFTGVFFKVKAGLFRDYNISKREWVLDGESVLYANADMIRLTLDYDFSQEKAFDYSKLSIEESIKHLTRFIANIWQIHPFGDALVPQGTNVNNFHSCKRRGAAYGNTRTTAVFTIKYLNSLGFDVNNEPFEKNSWYFRNALVRANYTNMNIGIYMNTEYLEKFFRNLLLGESNELKNRYCHIKYNEKVAINTPKSSDKTATKEKSSDIILNYLKENASINNSTAREITGLTAPAVRKIFKKLEAEGLIVGTGENKNRTYSLKR
ncbi:MAG: Fic family protein [Treponema sp.]|nr:Fic family protein [Treponema sp.]